MKALPRIEHVLSKPPSIFDGRQIHFYPLPCVRHSINLHSGVVGGPWLLFLAILVIHLRRVQRRCISENFQLTPLTLMVLWHWYSPRRRCYPHHFCQGPPLNMLNRNPTLQRCNPPTNESHRSHRRNSQCRALGIGALSCGAGNAPRPSCCPSIGLRITSSRWPNQRPGGGQWFHCCFLG